ncbi:SDR family NAD(P)-dependent oxidoreductase [Streptomyces decoyicus]|uniref:SDR family NAD(P)-dependent oxidoreductase n=1 Tax=Streptomyces decoyicus TaxID=249567 RepID=UPI0038079F58
MDLRLDDQVYLVTGSSSGLGFATTKELMREGAQVAISGRSSSGVEAAVARLGPSEKLLGIVADNSDEDAADLLVRATLEKFGQLDGVIVSVGGPPAGYILEVPDESWRAAFESVFLGALRLARVSSRAMAPGSSITFVLSTSVYSPIGQIAISGGLRPGLAMSARSLALELGPTRGIRVNGILPGAFSTDRARALQQDSPESSENADNALSAPLGRNGEPEEFARAAAFLASPAASYISGAMLAVDGGVLAR